MFTKVVMAGTKLDRHGERISKEALEQAAQQINGERAVRVGVEHDPTIAPIGKVLRAHVEPTSDGEFQLVAYQELFEDPTWFQLPDGTPALKFASRADSRPFSLHREFTGEELGVAYDGLNFETNEDLDAFWEEATLWGEVQYEEHQIFRKSVIPDPELILGIAKTVGAYFAGKKILDRVGTQIADDIGNDLVSLYRSIKATAVAAAKYLIPKSRPITYVFIAMEDPLKIEFTVQTRDPQNVIDHVTMEKIEGPVKRALELHQTLGAEQVQFLLHEAGTWDFNFLLTKSGEVIGSPHIMHQQAKRINMATKEQLDRAVSRGEAPQPVRKVRKQSRTKEVQSDFRR